SRCCKGAPALYLPPATRRPQAFDLRLLRSQVIWKNGCHRFVPGHDGRPGVGRNAKVVRSRGVHEVSLSARLECRNRRGPGRIPAQKDARRTGHRGRRLAPHPRFVSPEISRLALFLWLSGVSESGGPDPPICPAPSRGKYRSAPDHRISSGSRAVHISYRGPPSRREVFRGVGAGRYLSACPGIKESDAGNFEMFGVPRNQRKVVVQGGGSEKPVNNRQRRSPGSCATRESSPAVGDGLIDSKDAVRKPKRQVP